MNKISKIALLAIVAISVALMGWAVVVGASAPESDKIAGTMPLVGQYDENCDPVKDEKGKKIIPVTTTGDGIVAMNSATIYQMRNAEGLNYVNTVNEIKDVDFTLAGYEADYNKSVARIAEIEDLKVNDAKAYKKDKKKLDEELAAAQKYVAEYEEKGYAARLEREHKWAKSIEGVTGSQFDKESALVIAYLAEKKAGYEANLASLEEQMAAQREALVAQLDLFNAACEVLEVELVQKRTNPEDEESDLMPDYKTTIERYNEALKANKAKLSKEQKAALNACTATVLADVQAYDTLASDITTVKINIETITTNIDTLKKAVELAKQEGQHLMSLAKAINANLYWLYFLMVFAVVFVIAGFVLNFIQNPNWVKIGVAVGVVAVVCGLAYAIGAAHGWLNGEILYVLDANGNSTDIAFGLGTIGSDSRYEFTGGDYMLADVSIWITYIAFILAAVSAVFSWIWGIFKS